LSVMASFRVPVGAEPPPLPPQAASRASNAAVMASTPMVAGLNELLMNVIVDPSCVVDLPITGLPKCQK
jgi:hypothetical protein